MKGFKFLRISLALAICSFYIFSVGFIGHTDLGQAFYVVSEENSDKQTTTTTTQSKQTTTTPKQTVTEDIPQPNTQPPLQLLPPNGPTDDLVIEVTPSIEDVPLVTVPVVSTPSQTTTTTTTTTTKPTTTPKPSSSQSTTTTTTPSKTTTTTTTPKPTTTTTTPQTTTTAQPQIAWAGNLTVKNNLSYSSDYGKVVTADAYTIVCRNVQAEMGPSYHPEALKAQAITAYSYIKSMGRAVPSLPLADKVSSEVKNAVSAVNGYAVAYNGAYAQTVYFASSGGATANAQEVWGGYIPYLVSVPCPVDAQYSNYYGVTKTFTSAQMSQYVKNSTGVALTGDPNTWFNVIRSSSGYVNYVNIGAQGSVTGQQFRANVMSYKILSANFTITYDSASDLFTIKTFGFGHGVGMSQTGANYYAKYNGWTYKQIITHFYKGTTIERG